MATAVVLEVPSHVDVVECMHTIVCVEHRKDPIVYHGSKVPIVSKSIGAEKLGLALGCKPLFGALYQFQILFEGIACVGPQENEPAPWRAQKNGLMACGAERVYVSPLLLAPLPTLR